MADRGTGRLGGIGKGASTRAASATAVPVGHSLSTSANETMTGPVPRRLIPVTARDSDGSAKGCAPGAEAGTGRAIPSAWPSSAAALQKEKSKTARNKILAARFMMRV